MCGRTAAAAAVAAGRMVVCRRVGMLRAIFVCSAGPAATAGKTAEVRASITPRSDILALQPAQSAVHRSECQHGKQSKDVSYLCLSSSAILADRQAGLQVAPVGGAGSA